MGTNVGTQTMPVKSSSDKRYLEKHGDQWRVTLAVPRHLHARLGTRLKQALYTDSLAVANRLKWGVLDQLRERIDQETLGDIQDSASMLQEALIVRKLYDAAVDPRLEEDIRSGVRSRAHEILGPEVRVEHYDEGDLPVYDKQRERLANTYTQVATGGGVPLMLHYDEYIGQLTLNRRTIADDKRGIGYLMAWCEKHGVDDDIAAITTKVAKQFARDLPALANGIQPRTVLKYLTRLGQFWGYLVYNEHYDENPWRSVVIKVDETPHDEEERSFTDDEVRRLLLGGATQEMLDLMMIAALSGARLDAIVDMKVRDAVDGAFTFKPQKKEKTARDVPIHPALKDIVMRRTQGRAPDDEFFPEWPGPKKPGSLRERSFKASNEFTDYRRACGVDQRIPGRRRSLVNFHSFRRWFITKAERSNSRGELIAAIVGHKRTGMTLGRYSEGPEMKAARRCVAAVKLPALDGGPVVEPRALTPRKR